MKALYALVGIISGLVIGLGIPRPSIVVAEKTIATSLMGSAFDAQFLDRVVTHNEERLKLFDQALKQSENEAIKSFAQDGIVSIGEEMKLVEMLSGFDAQE